MAHTTKRNRTTTSLSLAALILSLGIEPAPSEAQQAAETPEALQGGAPAGGGGAAIDLGLTNGGVGGGVIGGDTSTTLPPPDQIIYVGPPGSGYVFTSPPTGDYSFEPPGSPRCGGNGGLPLCEAGPVCCPDPNLVHRQICCEPPTGAL
jgi:hypothetical protein